MTADDIQTRAQTFGIRQLQALHPLPLSWSDTGEIFERVLDDVVRAVGYEDAALDLFSYEARLAFYGLMTDRKNIRDWSMIRDVARAELIASEREDEAAQAADHRADMARELV